jgi:hypothetical protein
VSTPEAVSAEMELPRPAKTVGYALSQGAFARFGCAASLLAGACLKAHQLVTDPALGVLHGSRWLQVGLVEYELVLATWLLSGVGSTRCRRVTFASFTSFGCYSLYLGMTGATSCGCFGRLHVSPWLTLMLDAFSILLLWWWQPAGMNPGTDRTTPLNGAMLAATALLGGIAITVISFVNFHQAVISVEGLTVNESFTILEPEKWIGKPFPLVDQIDIGERLITGSWLVLFFHHDCSSCQKVISEYHEFSQKLDGIEIALIQVPPIGELSSTSGFMRGRLNNDKQWFVTTPTAIELSEGTVVAARSGDRASEFRGLGRNRIPAR